jgi:hypothetical protein
MMAYPYSVTPAKAGVSILGALSLEIPAFAGMTKIGGRA